MLADSYNGYTLDFNIYTGDPQSLSGHGLPYDSVMTLLNPSYLGIGYNLYVDKFHTSPKLFKDLYYLNIGACGPYRENRRDCPQAQNNALTKKDLRGTLRWIREGPLVFVKWMDSQEVSFCSTIHPAFAGDTVMRHKKFTDVDMTVIDTTVISCPKPVTEYNKNMGGVEFFRSAHTEPSGSLQNNALVPGCFLSFDGYCSYQCIPSTQGAVPREFSNSHDSQEIPGGADSPAVWTDHINPTFPGPRATLASANKPSDREEQARILWEERMCLLQENKQKGAGYSLEMSCV